MNVKFTQEEEKAINEIYLKYRPDLKKYSDKLLNEIDMETDHEKFIELSDLYYELNEKIRKESDEYYKSAELRAFNDIKDDVSIIVKNVKNQIDSFIYTSKLIAGKPPTKKERAERQTFIDAEKDKIKKGIELNEKLIEQYPDNEELIKNTKELREINVEDIMGFHYDMLYSKQSLSKRIKNSFSMYFEFISKTSPDDYKNLQAYIEDAIEKKDKIKIKYPVEHQRKKKGEATRTNYPTHFIAPTDKVSRLAFDGKFTDTPTPLAMENRKSRKKITSYVSIDFDDLNGSIQIKGRRKLTPYDREVHDAIATLFVIGENEYITPQMIYKVITGNPEARLEKKQAEAISNSITKCMYSKITINAKEEAAAYGFDDFNYDGNLISGERKTATLNGTVLECLHILRSPILYELANNKNQISRFDIKLLNTPINKTEEIIVLQGYLYRRILSMKNNYNLSKTIVYSTVYEQIDVTAASDGALRKKKSKVRGQIKEILTYWKEEGFILGYCENKHGQELYSVTIRF